MRPYRVATALAQGVRGGAALGTAEACRLQERAAGQSPKHKIGWPEPPKCGRGCATALAQRVRGGAPLGTAEAQAS